MELPGLVEGISCAVERADDGARCSTHWCQSLMGGETMDHYISTSWLWSLAVQLLVACLALLCLSPHP
eukprot:16446294-Heterocapsa_arctica.AAC.1